jgi:cbb3-type cytochrome oxidase maturation protein
MEVILILITLSLLLALGFLGAFLWAVLSNQYEDTYTPSMRILLEPDVNNEEEKINNKNGDFDDR